MKNVEYGIVDEKQGFIELQQQDLQYFSFRTKNTGDLTIIGLENKNPIFVANFDKKLKLKDNEPIIEMTPRHLKVTLRKVKSLIRALNIEKIPFAKDLDRIILN